MSEAPYAKVKTNLAFEQGWNRLQTVIEIGATAIVLAGLAGLLGSGPLSRTSTTASGGWIDIAYDRILRRTQPSDMVVDLEKPLAKGSAEIEFSTSLLDSMDIVTASPRPSAMRAEADGVTYSFDLGPARKGRVTITMKPKTFGVLSTSVLVDGAVIPLRQFVLP